MDPQAQNVPLGQSDQDEVWQTNHAALSKEILPWSGIEKRES
jgi:hypothetical protein